MSHEFGEFPETSEQKEWVDSLEEDVLTRHAHEATKKAIARAERIKSGQWMPDMQTVDVALKLANSWLDRLAPNLGKAYHYKIRDVGDTYQVYQDIDTDKKKRDTSDGTGLEEA